MMNDEGFAFENWKRFRSCDSRSTDAPVGRINRRSGAENFNQGSNAWLEPVLRHMNEDRVWYNRDGNSKAVLCQNRVVIALNSAVFMEIAVICYIKCIKMIGKTRR